MTEIQRGGWPGHMAWPDIHSSHLMYWNQFFTHLSHEWGYRRSAAPFLEWTEHFKEGLTLRGIVNATRIKGLSMVVGQTGIDRQPLKHSLPQLLTSQVDQRKSQKVNKKGLSWVGGWVILFDEQWILNQCVYWWRSWILSNLERSDWAMKFPSEQEYMRAGANR